MALLGTYCGVTKKGTYTTLEVHAGSAILTQTPNPHDQFVQTFVYEGETTYSGATLMLMPSKQTTYLENRTGGLTSPLSPPRAQKYTGEPKVFTAHTDPQGYVDIDGNMLVNPTRHIMFSSEHVTEGHPDKLCDQVSDAVLDACLKVDPRSKVACETCSKTGMVMVFGEITTTAVLDYQKIVREAVKDIGFDDGSKGLDYKSLNLLVAIEQQSPDIAQAVDRAGGDEALGAGDQGMMFGYATDETETLMPLTYELARGLAKKHSELRRNGGLPWARPDAKTQVTVEYELDTRGGKQLLTPLRIQCILISTQHSDDVTNDVIAADLREKVIKAVCPANLLDDKTEYWLNPSGRFVIGGPQGDAGLTGRKIIVDTYGGWGAHGGGAFSGKDPSKVDRSAAYAARWIAKSLVAAKLAKRVLVQLAYAIGVAEPLSIHVESYGTHAEGYTDEKLLEIVKKNFKLRPYDIIKELDLRRPIYYQTARFGHFGRVDEIGAGGFTWETPKKLEL